MAARQRIMVVDDDPWFLRLMSHVLESMGYEMVPVQDVRRVVGRALETDPQLVLLDIDMPVMDGYEALQALKSQQGTRSIPVVMVTGSEGEEARAKALELGADDFLSKPVEKTLLKARVRSLVRIKAYHDRLAEYRRELEEKVDRRTAQLRDALQLLKDSSLEMIYRLSRAAEFRDEDTGDHLKRMSQYSAAIAARMGLDDDTVEAILYASPMHDVGKIGIPDRILLKDGALDDEEWRIMKKHTVIGARILEGSHARFIHLAETIALSHHEKWDGSGYPQGLKGEAIPLPGRIVAVADVFDALTSDRSYKKAYPVETALKIVREGRGSHFDPAVVDVFFNILDEILEIKRRYSVPWLKSPLRENDGGKEVQRTFPDQPSIFSRFISKRP